MCKERTLSASEVVEQNEKRLFHTISQGEILTLVEGLSYATGTLEAAFRFMRDSEEPLDQDKLKDVIRSCSVRISHVNDSLLRKLLKVRE